MSAIARFSHAAIIRALSGPGIALAEQIANTAWNFLFGAFIARYGSIDIFSLYAALMAGGYLVASPLNGMTVAIISVDSAKLDVAKAAYLKSAAGWIEIIAAIVVTPVILIVFLNSLSTIKPGETVYLVMFSLYAASNVYSDLLRRLNILNGSDTLVFILSSIRLGTILMIFMAELISGSEPSRILYVVVTGAMMVTLVFSGILGWSIRGRAHRSKRKTRLPLYRILRYGTWSFASTLTLTSLDQGLLVYASTIGLNLIAGEIRAASYIFGILNPVLLVVDLLLPKYFTKFLGKSPSVLQVLSFVSVVGLVGSALSFMICIISVKFWLPFLGSKYEHLAPLSFMAGAAFSCMFMRTAAMPIIRTRAPRLIFASSIAGTISGFLTIIILAPLTSYTISAALLVSSSVLLVSTLFIAVITSLKINKP